MTLLNIAVDTYEVLIEYGATTSQNSWSMHGGNDSTSSGESFIVLYALWVQWSTHANGLAKLVHGSTRSLQIRAINIPMIRV